MAVPQPDWRDAVKESRTSHGVAVDPIAFYGSRIEAIDVQTGEVLASHYTDETLDVFLEDGTVLGYTENWRGVPIVRQYRPKIRR